MNRLLSALLAFALCPSPLPAAVVVGNPAAGSAANPGAAAGAAPNAPSLELAPALSDGAGLPLNLAAPNLPALPENGLPQPALAPTPPALPVSAALTAAPETLPLPTPLAGEPGIRAAKTPRAERREGDAAPADDTAFGGLLQESSSRSPGKAFDGAKKTADPIAYVDLLTELSTLEHQAQLEAAKREREADRQIREELGISVGDLRLEESGAGPGGVSVVVLSKPARSPFFALSRGDLVTVSGGGEEADGTVHEVSGNLLAVALQTPQALPPRGLRVEVRDSDATHQRIQTALNDLRRTRDPRVLRLRDVLLGLRQGEADPLADVRFINGGLNEFQQDAVRKALAAKDAAVIHGPAGTGKTTTLVELILQAAFRGQKILATAPSNVAVDNMLERLMGSGFNIVRLGHPSRTSEALRKANIDVLMEAEPEGDRLARLRLELEKLGLDYVEPLGRSRKGKRQQMEEERAALRRQITELERELRSRILERADIVLATHGGISGRLRREPFDLAVMDEASQATEALSWIPLLQTRKAVFAGDPRQLKPTLQSQEAKRRGLGETIMARLMDILPERLRSFLAIQYRMHPDIMRFASDEFYEGRLRAAPATIRHVADKLPGAKSTELTRARVLFIDTAGTGFEESRRAWSTSYENHGEAGLALRVVEELAQAGLTPAQIGVIASYAAQARHLGKLPLAEGLQTATVDGFQSREKEVILVSLVRSSPEGGLGFLEERERLATALTRARRLLIVVGDGRTLARNPVLARFIRYAKSKDGYRSAFEWPE